MCGRYTFIPTADILDLFEIENREFELQENYNVAPGQIMPVVTMNSPKTFINMKWGLIPFWAKDPKIGYRMINARGEELPQKPSFRGPLKNKRCLIPAAGFYEWDKKGKVKVPHYFRLKNREIFSFAGLFDKWKDVSGQEIYTYTIITIEANKLIGKIHDRMPVILKKEDEEKWADNSEFDLKELGKLIRPYDEDEMIDSIVSTRVNKPENNDPSLIV